MGRIYKFRRRRRGPIWRLILPLAAITAGLFAVGTGPDLDRMLEAAPPAFQDVAADLRDTFADHMPFVAPGGDAVLTGRVSHIRDGDTLEIGGLPIRFIDLDCPELGTTEGQTAREQLVRLARGRALSCRLTGERSYDRHLGTCVRDDGTPIASAMRDKGICR